MEEIVVLNLSYVKRKINSCVRSSIVYQIQNLREAHHFPLRKRI